MSRVSKMSLDKILDITGIAFNETDIYYFCDNKEIIDAFIEVCRENNMSIRSFLLEYEEEINKEKMVLCLYFNYLKSLESITKKKDFFAMNSKLLSEKQNIDNEEKIQKDYLDKICKLCKDMEAYTVLTNNFKEEYNATVFFSKELFQKRQISDKKNLERWKVIDEEIGDEGNGSIHIIQFLLVSDLTALFPTEEIGLTIREVILNNSIIRNRNISRKELEYIRDNNYEEYIELIDSTQTEEYLPLLRQEIIKNIRFIDIDKLLLMVGYRIENSMENGFVEKKDAQTLYHITRYVKEKIDNKKISFKDVLQAQKTYEPIEVEYSYNELEKFIERFIDGKYITKKEISENREKFLEGEKTLEDFELPFFNLLNIKQEEIEQIMYNSNENFIFGTKALTLNECEIQKRLGEHQNLISLSLINFLYKNKIISMETLINLYSNSLISAEFFKEFSEEKDISSEINIDKINQLHTEIKSSKEAEEEKKKKLDTMIELYRIANLDEKEDEEKDETYREVIEVAEGEEDILFYYDKGLLTLQIVADWSGENAISKLYDQSKINMEDLEELYAQGKITIGLIQDKFIPEGLNYSDLLSKIASGYLSEDKIIDLYMRGKIFDYDFEEMFTNGIVTIQKYLDATSKRTKEELEKNAKIKFEPVLVNIPDKKIRLNTIDGENNNENFGITSETRKTLIDPNIRFEFLKLLGAKEAIAEIEDENNAFYNYEFFVIPDAEGNLQANSVVIAERFYEDKETQDKFATSNATYFFQYKDLMVNSNLSKKEMTQDRENIVFTANHRAGSWAVSVLYKIAQTMAGKNFKEYKKGDERASIVIDNLLKLYSKEQLDMILNLTGKIDDTGEYIYEEVNSSFGKRSHEDDDDEVSL